MSELGLSDDQMMILLRFIGKDAINAEFKCGTQVQKTKSKEDDRNPDGALCTIVGSIDVPFEVTELQYKETGEYSEVLYLVEFGEFPGATTMISDFRLKNVD